MWRQLLWAAAVHLSVAADDKMIGGKRKVVGQAGPIYRAGQFILFLMLKGRDLLGIHSIQSSPTLNITCTDWLILKTDLKLDYLGLHFTWHEIRLRVNTGGILAGSSSTERCWATHLVDNTSATRHSQSQPVTLITEDWKTNNILHWQ